MKQKRKVKSLLPYKIDRDGTMLTILLLILSLVLCLGSASLMTVSVGAADDRGNYKMVYPGIDDKVEVLYGLQISDRNRLWDEFVNQFFMKDKTLYLSPNQVKVKSKDSSFHDNTVDTGKYINVLGGEYNEVKSDNITLIAGYHNVVDGGNDNASILGGEENKIKGTSSGSPAVIAGGRYNEIQRNNSNVIIGGYKNTITGAENAVILGGSGNKINGGNNIIVGGSNVEVNGVDNVFVYSNSSSKFNPKSSNAFYLNLSDGVGINADAAKGGVSVSGAVGFGEIDINTPCSEDNIGVIGSWEGCLVGCTKESGNRWELLDRGAFCEEKCGVSSRCMYEPENLSNENVSDYLGFCTNHFTPKNATRCTTGENKHYNNVVFETIVIGPDVECPVSGDNKCVYRCNPGSDYDESTSTCNKKCSLPWNREEFTGHGTIITAYNSGSTVCASDRDNQPSPTPHTCADHKAKLICDDGKWYVLDSQGRKTNDTNDKKKYYLEKCELEGYRCNTGTYDLTVTYIERTMKDTPQSSGRVVKDRNEVKGKRGQYKICIDYNASEKSPHAKALNGELCDTGSVSQPYHYKFIKCQEGYHTGVSHPNVCMQDCLLTGLNGIATGYRHGITITGYMATGATCTGTCAAHKIVCNDGTWRLSKLTGEVTTAFPYNDCVLSDKVCTGYDINQSIYNQHHSNSVYDACVPYSGNGKFTCNKQVTGYKLTDCISGNHTELEDESWMKWCISNEKVVNCQTGDKDLLKYEYIITGVKITWSGSWNTGYWSEPKVCEWKCGKDFHLSGDYFSGGVCVSNTGSAPCKTGWAEGHVKYIEEDVVISWSGSWNTGSWTEPGNCRLTGCEAGWCGPNCLYTGADIQCKERTNLRSGEVNIIESSFVACGDEPEPCKLKCIDSYHETESGACEPNIKREPCEQIDRTKLYDTSFMLEYLWTDGQWKLSNASGTECPIGDGTAMFEPGPDFNTSLIGLAGGNYKIKKVERVSSIPSGMRDLKEIHSSDSELPIYAWYDDGTIYYYTQASIIYLNPDSSNMFASINYNLGSEGLTSIDMSGWNTSKVTNMYNMFYGCRGLTTLDVGNWDTSRVKNMGKMFARCDSLENLDVSGWDVSNVEDMSYMFQKCNITGLDVSNWNTSSVENMNGMFYDCRSLQNLNVSGWNVGNVTTMQDMFVLCMALTGLNVSNWNTSSVENMEQMFFGCGNLKNLDVSKWEVGNVKNMHGMFDECESLKNLDVSNWNTSSVENMDAMFMACRNLTGLDVSKWEVGNVKNMGAMFTACRNLKNLDVSNWNTSRVENMEGMFADATSLTELNLCGWNTSKVGSVDEQNESMNSMFMNTTSLTTIYASTGFVSSNCRQNGDTTDRCFQMFSGAVKIKGGNGTTYSKSHKGSDYARIDKAGQAGYFTACEGGTLTCPAPTITKVEGKDVYFDLNGADANSVNMQVSADKTSWTSNTFGPSNKLPILTSLDRGYVKLITRCKNGLSSDESNIAEFGRNYGRMVIDDIKNCMMSYHFEGGDDPLSGKTCCTDARLDHSDDGITWFPTTTTYSSPMKITSQGSEGMIYLKYRINGGDWSDVVSYNMPKQTGCYTKNAKKFYDETCLDWVPDGLYLPDGTLLTTISGWWWYSYKDNIEQFFNPIVHDGIHNYTPANGYFLGDTDINKVSGAIIEKSAYSDTVLVYAPCDSGQWCKFDLSWEAVPWNEYTEGSEKYTRFIRNLQRYSVGDLNGWCY